MRIGSWLRNPLRIRINSNTTDCLFSYFQISDKMLNLVDASLIQKKHPPSIWEEDVLNHISSLHPPVKCAAADGPFNSSFAFLLLFPAPNSDFHPFFPITPLLRTRAMNNRKTEFVQHVFRRKIRFVWGFPIHVSVEWQVKLIRFFWFYPQTAESGQTLGCNARWRPRYPNTTTLRVSFLSSSHRL